MGKSTISMAIFHCYVSSPEGIDLVPSHWQSIQHFSIPQVQPPAVAFRGRLSDAPHNLTTPLGGWSFVGRKRSDFLLETGMYPLVI